jgi:thermitase
MKYPRNPLLYSRLRYCLSLLQTLILVLVFWSTFWFTVKQSWASGDSHSISQLMVATQQEASAQGEESNSATRQVIRGMVVTAPPNGIGRWVIQTSDQHRHEVHVDSHRTLPDGILSTASWVYADVQRQGNRQLFANQIRLDAYEPGQIVARLATASISSTIASRYDLTISSTLLTSGHIYRFTTRDLQADVVNLVEQMNADADIIWAELNYINSTSQGAPYRTWAWAGPEPAGYLNQEAYAQVNLPPNLEQYRGNGVTVALLDTGIDLAHPALAGHWVAGYDFVNDDADPQDEGPGLGWGHGTHIGGIITHIAPESKIIPLRVLDSNARGDIFTLAYAVEWAVANGADVINLSLGAESDSTLLRETLAETHASGVIIVAAAGNANTNEQQHPATYPGVIGVTALDGENRKAEFANYGSWVTLAAPGVGLTSTIVGPQGSGYAVWSGTSVATAFVSGAVALTRQKLPAATPDEIVQLLTGHAHNIDSANPDHAGELGSLLDIGAAVTADEQTLDREVHLPIVVR